MAFADLVDQLKSPGLHWTDQIQELLHVPSEVPCLTNDPLTLLV